MNYQETLTFLYERLPMFQRVGKSAFKKDLSNTILMCEMLGNPQNKITSVHIAGTNGKGSTAHTITSILQESGLSIGLYTSPHLKSFTERIKINGSEADKEYIINFVAENRKMIEEVKPSFFEITVVMAFDYFAKNKVDLAVIEVGMGGRFDSTNVIDPILSVITSIGMDHMEYLGNDLPTIAYEKAGIIKPYRPVIISTRQAETDAVFEKKAGDCQSNIYFAEDELKLIALGSGVYELSSAFLNGTFEFELKGDYQIKNLPGIAKAYDLLGKNGIKLNEENFRNGLKNVIQNTGLKGRWQILQDKPLIICDTGHNKDGMIQILNQIKKQHYQKLYAVLGFVNDKDIKSILELWPKDSHFVFCKPDIPRGMETDEVLKIAKELDLEFEVEPRVNDAIRRAKEISTEEDLIFIGGSTFVVAEIDNL